MNKKKYKEQARRLLEKSKAYQEARKVSLAEVLLEAVKRLLAVLRKGRS